MSDLNISLYEQTGGWFNIEIILLDEITNCPSVLTNNNASNFSYTITPPSNFKILPIPENIRVSEPIQKTKSGMLYNIKCDFLINQNKSDIDTSLNKYIHKKVVFIGTKHYGQRKLYGSKRFPLQFKYEFLNGKNYQDGSNVRVTIYGKIPQKPVFIND